VIEFALGALAASCLFVFWPDLAVIPAGLLRKGWEWIKRRSPKE
jgi:hypothetical protein